METFEKSREFIYRNARPLDLARWQYHFENGTKEAVLNALSFYQNEDGGFGHAIEPDLWNQESSPISTNTAIAILREIEFYDNTHCIVKGILSYLETTNAQHEYGWFLKIPSNNDYPHSPWWHYTKETEIGFSGKLEYNPTASIVDYILKVSDKSTNLYKKATHIAKIASKKILTNVNMEMHEAGCMVEMFNYSELSNILDDSETLINKLKTIVNNGLEKDISKWNGYIAKPSSFFNTKDSIYYHDNKEIAKYESDFIIKTQLEDGSWNISWSWNKYPEEWAIAKNWWKANGILVNLCYLKGMGELRYI